MEPHRGTTTGDDLPRRFLLSDELRSMRGTTRLELQQKGKPFGGALRRWRRPGHIGGGDPLGELGAVLELLEVRRGVEVGARGRRGGEAEIMTWSPGGGGPARGAEPKNH